MSRLVVIGGGPAGMMAAGTAAAHGVSVTLLEKNEKLGKKLYITGKGRCNLTNNTDIPGLMSSILTNPRFLHSAFYAMDATALMAFFEGKGVPLKTERGGRVFPVSDNSGDINDALKAYLRVSRVRVELNCAVKNISHCTIPEQGISQENSKCSLSFIISTARDTIYADAIIIATGGLSYPSTGSTGDGFGWAKALGHTVTPTHPSLVPMQAPEPWLHDLAGLSLKNVRCTATISGEISQFRDGYEIISTNSASQRHVSPRKPSQNDGKPAIVYDEIGEMMFTPTGITGPLILKASAFLAGKWEQTPVITIDLKPGLSPEQLDARILRDFSAHQNKDFANALDGLLPQRLIETIIQLSNIPPNKKVHTITRAERQQLVNLLKNLHIRPTGNAGYKEAVITKGGISTKEVNPSTLMSKHSPGLFFAGEMLDVDALTGGYNMQIAFSTGYLSGLSAAEYLAGF
ncbi:MAG: NAD(P)/FAD-dependent oxidoreductase [Defluviitaleaceae bacterium]|nr:NAD(P)/FAD-dependent oxidoreductase [Defluviitaleaceae bacterium]